MTYLLLILISFALLAGFLLLIQYEESHTIRFFADKRSKLDTAVERAQFIVEHVDLAAFVREELRRAGTILGHAVVNLSLQAVRAVERLLTRLVRHLRTRDESMSMPQETTREFVKTLADFKGTLKSAHPVPEIE